MKCNTKKWLLMVLLSCIFAMSAIGMVGIANANATVATNENVVMIDGASLRLEDSEQGIPFGLRFKTEINKEYFDGLQNPTVYTVLVPSTKVEGELTADTQSVVTAQNADAKKYVVGDNYRFNTVLTEIPSAAYGMDISVRSYVTSDSGTVYATNTVTRSVAQVADAALAIDSVKYASLAKYCVSGISVSNTGLPLGYTGNAPVKYEFFDCVAESTRTLIEETYPLTYTSANTDFVTVDDNGLLTPVSAGTSEITVGNETLGFSQTFNVTSYQPTYGELINFNAIDVTYISQYGLPTDLGVVEYGGKQALAFTHATHTNNEVGFYISMPAAWKGNFDTFTVNVRLNEETGDTAGGWLVYSNNSWPLNGSTNYQLGNAGDQKDFTRATYTDTERTELYTAFFKGADGDRDEFAVYVKNRNTKVADATFYITDISFGINDIESAGDAVNLYDKFHTSAGNATFTFTPDGGSATTVANPSAFIGAKSGKITATISMDGYAAGTVEANYVRTLPYGTLIDFNAIDASALTAYAGADGTCDMKIIEYQGAQAIQLTVASVEGKTTAFEFGVKIAKPDWFYNFDNVTVNATLMEEETSLDTNYYCLYNKTDNSFSHYWLKNPNDTISATAALGASGENSDHYGYLKGDPLKFAFKVRSAATTSKVVIIITGITFGFNDIAVTSGSSVSILDALGYTASELSNVTFTPDGGSAGAVADLTAFAPTASGVLNFTVTKEGYAPVAFSANVTVS